MSMCDVPMTMNVVPEGSNNNGNNCGGWGNGMWGMEWIWLIVILALVWGNNGAFGGNGNNGAGMNGGNYGSLCDAFSFQDVKNGVRGISDGICSLGYDVSSQINGVNMNIASLGAQLNNAICTTGYQSAQLANGIQMQVANEARNLDNAVCTTNFNTQQGFNNLTSTVQNCCCDVRDSLATGFGQARYDSLANSNATQSAIAQTNYNLATQSCDTRNTINGAARDIIDSNNAGVRAILDKLTQQELAAKDAQIAQQSQALFAAELRASQEAQNTFLVNRLAPCPIPAYPACPGQYQWQYATGNAFNNSCGCGCGCQG